MVWSVVTHEHRERSTDWYWTLAVLALAGIGASIFFSNILLAVIIALGAGSIGYLAARGPREHQVRIDSRGVSIDGTRYPWSAVHSFWVEHESDSPRLFITMRGVLQPQVSLVLDSRAQGDEVRAHLKRFVEEEEQSAHIGERLVEIFGL